MRLKTQGEPPIPVGRQRACSVARILYFSEARKKIFPYPGDDRMRGELWKNAEGYKEVMNAKEIII